MSIYPKLFIPGPTHVPKSIDKVATQQGQNVQEKKVFRKILVVSNHFLLVLQKITSYFQQIIFCLFARISFVFKIFFKDRNKLLSY